MTKGLLITFLWPFLLSSTAWSLPNVLEMNSGKIVKNISDWAIRKSEIRTLLQDQIYGHLPPRVPVTEISKNSFNDIELKAIIQNTKLKIGRYGTMDVLIIRPKGEGPFPAILVLNKCGNRTVWKNALIQGQGGPWLHQKCFEEGRLLKRGEHAEQIGVRQILESGMALVTWSESDVSPDHPDQQHLGVKGRYGKSHPDKEKSWGTLMAWAWGHQRVMDYLSDLPFIDSQKVAVMGHSRRGKAALLAAAFDERFRTALVHQSGTGGMALLRSVPLQEPAFAIANGWIGYSLMGEEKGLTHFFAPAFRIPSALPNQLEFDSHFLISLMAPRTLLALDGSRDAWAGPTTVPQAIRATKPVYNLYSKEARGLPVQWVLDKGHGIDGIDWIYMTEFAKTVFN